MATEVSICAEQFGSENRGGPGLLLSIPWVSFSELPEKNPRHWCASQRCKAGHSKTHLLVLQEDGKGFKEGGSPNKGLLRNCAVCVPGAAGCSQPVWGAGLELFGTSDNMVCRSVASLEWAAPQCIPSGAREERSCLEMSCTRSGRGRGVYF